MWSVFTHVYMVFSYMLYQTNEFKNTPYQYRFFFPKKRSQQVLFILKI